MEHSSIEDLRSVQEENLLDEEEHYEERDGTFYDKDSNVVGA